MLNEACGMDVQLSGRVLVSMWKALGGLPTLPKQSKTTATLVLWLITKRCLVRLLFLIFTGNPTIGILKYKEKYYTFNTRDAAYSFAENPEHYINLIKEKAKKNAELIQLLELHQQFETLIPYSQVNVGNTCSYLGL